MSKIYDDDIRFDSHEIVFAKKILFLYSLLSLFGNKRVAFWMAYIQKDVRPCTRYACECFYESHYNEANIAWTVLNL